MAVEVSATPAELDDIRTWREMYRSEMGCQIIHDSLHGRPGWTTEYTLCVGTTGVGYGSVAVAGPWTGKPTVYEFYVLPPHRGRLFDLFSALLQANATSSTDRMPYVRGRGRVRWRPRRTSYEQASPECV